jgi:hypothetical protein
MEKLRYAGAKGFILPKKRKKFIKTKKDKPIFIMEKKNILTILIIAVTLILVTISLVLTIPLTELPQKSLEDIKILSEQNPEDVDFIESIYHNITKKFKGKKLCFIRYFTKNFIFNPKKILSLENDCLPCQQYNKLFQSYLLSSGRFTKDQIKTQFTNKLPKVLIHVYTEVTLKDNTKINVDLWGKDFGVPFNKTIHDVILKQITH